MKLSLFMMLVPTCLTPSIAGAAKTRPPDRVVFVHGMGRSSWSLKLLEMKVKRSGYTVTGINYPSRKKKLDELSRFVTEKIAELVKEHPKQRLHFVTHSLGGLIVRACFKKDKPESLGRVVMLAPPNQGSEVADKLRKRLIYHWVNGPVGQQIGTKQDSIVHTLGPVRFELGVIAGNRSQNPFYSMLIPGQDDGKVAVDKTKVKGMTDFVVMPHGHTFLMNRKAVQRQVLHFLAHGKFKPLSTDGQD